MYESFYKLQGKPFQLTPDPEFLFPSVGHKRAMSYLRYGLEQGEGFVVITGDVGTGKTLLIQTLSKTLTNGSVAMATIGAANLKEEDVLPAVASAFKLPFERAGRETLYRELSRSLRSSHAHGNRRLLIVDEAQLLRPEALEVLRILSNLEVKGRALLQVFLVGQSELRQTLAESQMEPLKQRIIASCELQRLGEKECEAYILHRLRAVGWAADPSLAPAIFPIIHRASRGLPRKVNLIMGRLLLYGYLEELHEIDSAALTTVLREMEEELPAMDREPERTRPAAKRKGGSASDRRVDFSPLEITLERMLREVRANAGLPDDSQVDEVVRRLLLCRYLEELGEVDDPAIAAALREMKEELPLPVPTTGQTRGRNDGKTGQLQGHSLEEMDLASLEDKLIDVLMQVRENIRQQEESQAGKAARSGKA